MLVLVHGIYGFHVHCLVCHCGSVLGRFLCGSILGEVRCRVGIVFRLCVVVPSGNCICLKMITRCPSSFHLLCRFLFSLVC